MMCQEIAVKVYITKRQKLFTIAALDLSTYISYTMRLWIFGFILCWFTIYEPLQARRHNSSSTSPFLSTTTQKPFKINTIFPHYKIYCCSFLLFCLVENSINSFFFTSSSCSCFLMINNSLCAQIHILLLPNGGKNGKFPF